MTSKNDRNEAAAPKPDWYAGLRHSPFAGSFGENNRRHVIGRLHGRGSEGVNGFRRIKRYAAAGAAAVLLLVAVADPAGWREGPNAGIGNGNERETRNLYTAKNVKLVEAFPGGDYTAGNPAGCWWNVYEPFESLQDRTIRIEAVHRGTGYTMEELAETKLSEAGQAYGGFTRIPTRFALPLPGVWTFTVFLDGERYGDVAFDVPDHPWQVSPTFRGGAYELRGVQGRLGFIDAGFRAGRANKYMWHFWGRPDELRGELTIRAVRQGTSRIEELFAAPDTGSALNGADAAVPAMLTLPEPGLWRLMAFVGGRLYGSVVVEAEPSAGTDR
ncbi:DUF4871 domain-containing protein [Paenibacillus flagellatus]|uniref:DUF4871 domain-containing protein n=1 Tax=Paenibacillus flagellatus TaxID=2211139 RepID=A0A2V5K5D5_9BACL|nr:DUF4871 domain-containing protein [Paenibacillus flagellatus]PYI52883.1 DUF4871 domain-containing protein [Paenibacillus flagellatus]